MGSLVMTCPHDDMLTFEGGVAMLLQQKHVLFVLLWGVTKANKFMAERLQLQE